MKLEFIQSKSIKINLEADDWNQIASKEVIESMCERENSFAYDIIFNNEIIGFALFRHFEDGVFLWQYAIANSYQGKGYGYSALKELIQKLKNEKNISYFTTTYTYGNTRAKRLYEKLGFKEADVVDEDGIHEVNMDLFI